MPPAGKKSRKQNKPVDLASLSLTCSCFGNQAEIDVLIDGKWQTLAVVNRIGGLDAEEIAHVLINALKVAK